MSNQVEGLETRTLLSSWYVSASAGSASNPGTIGQPFLTIQQAANLALPGDTVFIRGGIYRETVVPAHSGTAAAPITYQPYNGEPVTIDGADPVTGWSQYNGSIYQANLGWDLGAGQNQVFVDGRMMNEARWPNSSLDVDHPTLAMTTSASVTLNPNGLSTATIGVSLNDPAGTWVGATIHISPGPAWVSQIGTVTASSPGSLTYSFQSVDPNEVASAGNKFYLAGLFRTLDGASEWYRDNSGKLYLWTPQGDSAANHAVEVKHRLYAFDLSGDSYINLNGINLFASTINTSSSSANNTLTGISAKYVSQSVNNLNPWDDNFLPHTTGIILNGTGNVLQNSTVQYSSGDGVFLGGSGNSVINCVIADVDYGGTDAAGISVLGNNEQILGSTIYNTGRSGIDFRQSGASKILHNVIHDIGLQETDLGGIYTYGTDGQGTEIAYNLIYNVHTGGFGAAGIYLDNFSANFVVDHNVVWNSDFALKLNSPSTNNAIYNNTLTGTIESIGSSGNESMPGTVFDDNIFTTHFEVGNGSTFSNNVYDYVNAQFVDAGHGVYQLKPTSPGIDAGLVLAPYTNGYVGWAPDDGAYEYGQTTFTAGSTLVSFAAASTNTATFLNNDLSTFGSWAGTYGSDGYGLLGSGASNYPSYAQVSATGALPWIWSSTTSNQVAPFASTATGPRIAACDYSATSFMLDVNLTDGKAHQIALYMLDFDNQGRTETVQIVDADTGTILNSQAVSGFQNGQYLVWNVTGHIQITVTRVGGINAVASALFFDPAATAQPTPASGLVATGFYAGVPLNWKTSPDSNVAGYNLFRGTSPNGPFTQINSGLLANPWYTDTNAPRGVVSYYAVEAVGTSGLSSTPVFASATRLAVDPTASAAPANFVASAFYIGVPLNWSGGNDGNTAGFNLFRATSASGPFTKINSSLLPNPWFTDTAGPRGVVSYYQVVAVNNAGVSSVAASTTATRPAGDASFLRSDLTTAGTYGGVYGSNGYALLGTTAATYPAYAQVATAGAAAATWSASTTDPRTLTLTPASSTRVAANVSSATSFSFDLNLTDGNTHRVSLYMVDFDSLGRSQTVQVTDAVTGAVLDTRTVSAFAGGQYLDWNLSGHVKITLTRLAGPSAVASGLFFDPAA